jgi:DNA helicase HerA-like ATPase
LSQVEKIGSNTDTFTSLFTNFDGKFKGRLSAVIPSHIGSSSSSSTSENAPISAKYDCRVKVEYHKDIMTLVEEGMVLAVKNFKASSTEKKNKMQSYTLLVISRIWPDHYGLKAISDHTYYPMQFEVIEQSVVDWDTDDKSTMMIQISAIPVNYDLVFNGSNGYDYVKGFSYPLVGDEAYLLNANTVKEMYNRKVLDKMHWDIKGTHSEARKDPRIGIIKMFENAEQKIPIYVNLDHIVRYHFGVFSFTGGGKSCLLSNVLRRILLHTKDTKIVIFDISSEYPFLLMDLLVDPTIPSKIVLESPIKSSDEFYVSVVKPKDFEDDVRVKQGLSKIFDRGIITHYIKPQYEIPRYSDIFEELSQLKNESTGKPHYVNAVEEIHQKIFNYLDVKALPETQFIDEAFISFLSQMATETVQTFKISEKAGLYAWATTRDRLTTHIRMTKRQNKDGVTTEQLRDIVEGDSRLTCISISDPYTIKQLVIEMSKDLLQRRKKQFKVRPYILLVFDEAQEFIPDLSNSRGIDNECSRAVEALLRQGRKYGLGGCIATQRIAYLNTNALQQLHTYFVGTLPRPYDRNLVSNTFTIDQGILEKTLEFSPGEWLLSSYIATGIENVPIFIKADNAEKEIESFLTRKV